jgi:hypothetical protein
MKYTILIYGNETNFATRSDEKRKESLLGRCKRSSGRSG